MAENFAETTRTVEFKMAVEMALAAERGIFRPLAAQGSDTGKAIEITDRFSRLRMQEIATRHAPTANSSPDVERRWIKKPRRSGVAPLLDPDDALATKVGLASPLAMGVADAQRAYADDQWLVGFYGNAWTGEDGATAVPFKAANIIPADFGETPSNFVGLTQKKLKRVQFLSRRLFNKNRPNDMMHVGITAYEVYDLMGMSEFINRETRAKVDLSPLENGEPAFFMGCMWVPSEFDTAGNYPNGAALAVNGSGHRRLPCWMPSGMYVNSWLEFDPHNDVRADLSHSEQFAGYSCIAAARLHEDKCFIIECAGTAAN